MIVIDANIAVWTVLKAIASPQIDVAGKVASWQQRQIQLIAPMLWVAECTSAIRRSVHTRVITLEQGRVALNDLLSLDVRIMSLDDELASAAYGWASRLGQVRAYDGFYLALAENLGVEFWSADERLVNSARQAGANWARWVGES